MEYLDGSDLEKSLAKASMPPTKACDIAYQIAGALEETHARGLIHRESGRLARLVENLLDFSRIEEGRKEYRMEPLDPSDPRLGDCLTRECAVLAVLAPAPPAASAGLETPPVAQTTPDPLY